MKYKYTNEAHNALKTYIKGLTFIYLPIIFIIFVLIGYWFLVGCMFYNGSNFLASVLSVFGVIFVVITLFSTSIFEYLLKPVRKRRYYVKRASFESYCDDSSNSSFREVMTDIGEKIYLFNFNHVEITKDTKIDIIVNMSDNNLFGVPTSEIIDSYDEDENDDEGKCVENAPDDSNGTGCSSDPDNEKNCKPDV